ncbi:MAG TPA: hypothetical protein VFZ76_19700 [Anaerolineales bacterium]
MKATAISSTGSSGTTILLGILAAALVFAVLSGRKVPLISGERAALIVLVVIGMAMCTNGIGRVAASGAWTHPLSILGYLLGALILVVAGAAILGRPLPLVPGVHQAIIAVSVLGVLKLVFSIVHRMFWV